MKRWRCGSTALLMLMLGAAAAGQRPPGEGGAAPARPQRADQPRLTDAARTALAEARALADQVRQAPEDRRATAIEAAARSYDRIARDFAAEPRAAGQAAFAAGDLWRRHGSHVLAEQSYLLAARVDHERFGQRATLAAADMQRRLDRNDEALATYGRVVEMDAGTSRAQTARLWRGRLQQRLGRLDEAIATFQAALEAAERPRQVIATVDYLARAFIDKHDFDAAARAIRHAEDVVAGAIGNDPIETERLQKLLAAMSARKALQRARDEASGAGRDAQDIERASGR